MNKISIFKSIISLFVITFFFASCDKDFNSIGSNVIDDNHFGFELDTLSSVVAVVQPTGIVQTNNLPVNQLGVYNNPVFGKTKANFVTQLTLPTLSQNPKFDLTLNPTIESVILTIPYFSHKTSTDASGVGIYTLDSIYGGEKPINLKVYESGYQIQDYDASTNAQESQKYYNNQDNVFNNNKIDFILNDSIVKKQNEEFVPDDKEVLVYKRDNRLFHTKEVESRLSPRMQLRLNKAYFYNKIFLASNDKLISNGSFKDYMKGLYFKVEDANEGNLMKLNFAAGNITITYKQYEGLKSVKINNVTVKVPITFDDDNNPATPEIDKLVLKTFVINLTGNSVNLLDQTNSNYYANAISNPSPVIGDQRLNLKGGADGSIAVIDLFGKDLHGADGTTGAPNGIADELDIIKKNKWLINEANLTFYLDKDNMKLKDDDDIAYKTYTSNRVYLYDLNNHLPIQDYASDFSTNINSKLNKVIHGGIMQKMDDKKRIKYKIRITNHLRYLMSNDTITNVRLGLAVTESILLTSNAKLKNITSPASIDRVPLSNVMNNLGTILYGNNIPVSDKIPYRDRLKLEIYYTKIN
jgi:hypothetical protein